MSGRKKDHEGAKLDSALPLSNSISDVDDRERLSALIDSIQDEVWFVDESAKLVLANRAVNEEFGTGLINEETQKIASSFEVYRPDGTPRPVEEAPPLRALKGEIVKNQEEIVRTPATEGLRHRQVSAAPVKNSRGRIIGSVSVVRDITDQKQAETRLKNDLIVLTRLHDLSKRFLDMRGFQPLLHEILDAAIEIMDADKGTLQLFEGNSLRIVAHHGHREPFLKHFGCAENVASVCGEATRRGERVIVPNVERSSLFVGTSSLQVLLDADVHAVQSTPIRTRTGAFLGILTTQWSVPHSPNEHDLWKLDLLVRQVADLIENSRDKEELRSSRARLEKAFASMTEAIFIADADGRLIDFNDEFIRYHRFRNRAECSKTIAECPTYLDAYFPDGSPAPTEMWAMPRALRGEMGSNVEYMLRKKDTGETWWGSYSFGPIRDEQGRIIGAVVVGRETTERKRAEEALVHERDMLQQVMNGAKNSHLVYLDRDFNFVRVNETYARTCGYKPEEMIGKNHFALYPHAENEAIFKHVRDSGEMVSYHDKPFTFPDQPERGVTYWDWTLTPLKDAAENVTGLVLSLFETTERKRAEAEVIQNQRTFSELVERAPFGIYIVNSEFRIAHMNAGSQTAAFRNLRPVIGRDFSEAMRILWPEPVAAEIIAHFRHTLETGEPYYSPRFTNPRHDVEITESYEWELHRMTLPDGQWGVICYYFNSTALRNAEMALREANATLEEKVEERTRELSQRAAQLRALTGELTLAEQRERSRLAIVLHDHLQQLLVAAKFRLTILGRGGDDVVKQAAKEVEQLIDDSVTASRSLTAELNPPILHEAGLNEGLQWLARRMADTQGLFVDLQLNENEPLPEDMKVLLFQSVRELLFNVVKHANTRSAVLNLRRFDSSLQITVSDQGIGFDPSALSTVGEGGRGYGLFGIRERIEFLGGKLEVQSSPGQGSRFVLSLPITPSVTMGEEPEKTLALSEEDLPPSIYANPEPKIRVLLADDHAIVRQGIAKLFANETDIEVIGQAVDGQEAVELTASLLPDVILMDASMPKLSGVEATRAIRNQFPEIRIIGLSMFEDAERAQAMRDAGAVDYLTKSGQADALINAIRKSVQASSSVLSGRPVNKQPVQTGDTRLRRSRASRKIGNKKTF
jgi:PAS domain S-box-containing protein